MKTYYTLQSAVIPQCNITRSFVSTCKFKEVVPCGRCNSPVVKIRKGYTASQLIIEIRNRDRLKLISSTYSAENKPLKDAAEVKSDYKRLFKNFMGFEKLKIEQGK